MSKPREGKLGSTKREICMETFQIENILYNLSLEEASNSQEIFTSCFETLNMVTELDPREEQQAPLITKPSL